MWAISVRQPKDVRRVEIVLLEEHDRRCREKQACSVKEELVVRSSAVSSVVVSAPGVGGAHLVDAQSQTDTEIANWSGAA